MNVAFMIGNGFDINLGLSTRYNDFIEAYRHIRQQDDAKIAIFKKDIISKNLPLWSNAEWAFGKNTEVISESFTVEDYCNCHSHFCTALAEYLKAEQKRLVINKENLQIITANFSKAVNDLAVGFRTVQQEQIQSVFSNYYEGITFNFIDFNYTNTLDVLCSQTNNSVGWKYNNNCKNSMGKLIHVHGTTDKDMVLGVHDESQIANIDSFKSYDTYYLAQLIKSQTDLINEENTYKRTLQILHSSKLIYIYGMSLGDTDKLWWKNICKLLIQNNGVRVVLHCYDMPENELLRTAIKRIEDRQRDKLLELGDVGKEQRSTLQGRIHVTGANIFKDLSNIATQRINKSKAS